MIEQKTLDCGIKVFFERMSAIKSISVGVWIKTGAVNENDKNSGISHYIEHMKFKDTENRTSKDIANEMDKTGGTWNAMTGKETTCYYFKVISEELEESLDLLVDMVLNSKYSEEDLLKERDVIIEELKMTEDDADDLAHKELSNIIFKGGDYEKEILGNEQSLHLINRDSIFEYFKDNYTRENIVISIVGEIENQDKIEQFLNEKFSVLNEKSKNRKPLKISKGEDYKPAFKSKIKDVEQGHICLGCKGIDINHKDYYAMVALNNILGIGYASKLFQNVREEKGLAYSVYSHMDAYTGEGMFYIYAGVNKDKVKDAVKGIKEELISLREDRITEEQLEMAKRQIKTSVIFGNENNFSRMISIGKDFLIKGRFLEQDEKIENINNITMAQIDRMIDLITDLDQYSGVVVNSKEEDLENYFKM